MATKPATPEASSVQDRYLSDASLYPTEGSCTCKYLRCRMVTKPLIVHCCHCTYCQHETGSAFAINAMIEANRVIHLNDTKPDIHEIPSESGRGQTIARCPKCNVTVWSNYDGPLLRFVKVGTLDKPAVCPPDVHIFTKSKQLWVGLPQGARVFERTYEDRNGVWDKQSLERWEVFEGKVRAWEEKVAKEQERGQTKGS